MTQDPEQLRARRSVGKWIALLVVWLVGLCVWAGYVALLFLGFLRVFSG
jgi:hypothetical protein